MRCLYCIPVYCLLLGASLAQGADVYQNVHGREFKFLIDPAKVSPAQVAFKEIWDALKDVAAQQGIAMTEREVSPFVPRTLVKTFFDTKDMDLARKGYLIRHIVNYKNGVPESLHQRLVIKTINPDFHTSLVAHLEPVQGMGKIATEENVSIDKNGQLSSYVEKGVHFEIATTDTLGNKTLADFGNHVPELLQLGLPPQTPLLPHTIFVLRCGPGFIQLPGMDTPVAVAMESWARTEGGAPVVYDFSWSYSGDYARMGMTHKASETFLLAIYAQLNNKLGFDTDAWQYGGSKVRLFFDTHQVKKR